MPETDGIDWVRDYLRSLAPADMPVKLDEKDPFQPDECRWFRTAVEKGVIEVRPCHPDCSMFRKREHPRKAEFREEFVIPGQRTDRVCHFFSFWKTGVTLNREYVVTVAAYTRVVVGLGYSKERSAFSKFQTFRRDLRHKHKGGRYETDSEFYDAQDKPYLQVEAKKDPELTAELARAIEEFGSLEAMREKPTKEAEYVLDLAPRFLWIVGPGTVDPEKYVFEVAVEGLNATFVRTDRIPPRPE